MPRLGIVTDSTADLSNALTSHPSVRVVPLRINWGEEVYRDRVELTPESFYGRLLAAPTLPTTSSPPVAAFEQAYADLLDAHDFVISIHLPAPLSATHSTAQTTAARVSAERIRVVDSGQISLPLGWLAEHALRLAEAGRDLNEITQELGELVPRFRLFATLDTLECLQRGGRIGRVAALAGTLLNLKPLIEIRQGQVLPLERVRTRPAAIRRLREMVLELGPVERLGVLHGHASEAAEELSLQLAAAYPNVDIEGGEISPVVGVHAGPGVVGVTCLLPAS